MTRVRRLANDIGASVQAVTGDDVPQTLLDFARGVNATQLVLGTSRRSRWARILDEGWQPPSSGTPAPSTSTW